MSQPHSDQPVGSAAQTVKEQATQVVEEVREQTRGVAHDLRDRVADEARTQNDRLAEGLRQMAHELSRMASDRPDTPARSVVQRIAQGGEQAADYLSKNGPDGVLAEIEDFARRRPGAFLATALVSGFLAGRVGKAVITATKSADTTSTGMTPAPTPAMHTGPEQTARMPVAQAPTEQLTPRGQAHVPEVPA